jgi:phage FluMu protein Com
MDTKVFTSNVWPIRTTPLEGELFGSWAARAALAIGLDPMAFPLLFPKSERKLDWEIDPRSSMVAQLAEEHLLPIKTLSETTLESQRDILWSPFQSIKAKSDWVLVKQTGQRSGICGVSQYCSMCAAENWPFYFRKEHRLAYSTHCLKHEIELRSKCPHCKSLINFQSSPPKTHSNDGENGLAKCRWCGKGLAKVRSSQSGRNNEVTRRAIALQESLANAFRNGWMDLGEVGVTPIQLVMAGMQNLIRILGSRHGYSLCMWVQHEGDLGELGEATKNASPFLRFEALSRADRIHVLAMVHWLLEEWPDRFIEAVHGCGFEGSFLLEDHIRELPYWYAYGAREALVCLRRRWHWSPPPQIAWQSKQLTRFHRLSCNTKERLQFVQQHPEHWNDIPLLGAQMQQAGLFQKGMDPNRLHSAVKRILRTIEGFHQERKKGKGSVTVFVHFMKMAYRKRLLQTIKHAIKTRLGLL